MQQKKKIKGYVALQSEQKEGGVLTKMASAVIICKWRNVREAAAFHGGSRDPTIEEPGWRASWACVRPDSRAGRANNLHGTLLS